MTPRPGEAAASAGSGAAVPAEAGAIGERAAAGATRRCAGRRISRCRLRCGRRRRGLAPRGGLSGCGGLAPTGRWGRRSRRRNRSRRASRRGGLLLPPARDRARRRSLPPPARDGARRRRCCLRLLRCERRADRVPAPGAGDPGRVVERGAAIRASPGRERIARPALRAGDDVALDEGPAVRAGVLEGRHRGLLSRRRRRLR